MSTNYILRDVERFTRFILGSGIVFSILVFPLTSTGIILACFLAFYPLITSLVALDPIFYIIDQYARSINYTSKNKIKIA